MNMTLDQFRSEALRQITVSKFGGQNKWKDGGYLGECVSLINQYCWRVLNVPAGAWGHAYAWANDTNPNRTYFTKVASPQVGDVGVSSGPTKDGHIWIYLDARTILEQNGKSARRVTVNPTYLKTTAILRPINNQGGNVSDFKQEAIDRMNMLVGIAKIVIPNFSGEVDGNNYPQIIANINQLYAQNNVVTGIAEDRLKRIKELEAGANGEFEPVPYPVYKKK